MPAAYPTLLRIQRTRIIMNVLTTQKKKSEIQEMRTHARMTEKVQIFFERPMNGTCNPYAGKARMAMNT